MQHYPESRTSMVYPTLVAVGCLIAGILILIEFFFFFGHQDTASATAAMVLGALLIVVPALLLMVSHAVHARSGAPVVRVQSAVTAPVPAPMPDPVAMQRDRDQQVADEVRRQLAAAFAGLTRVGSEVPQAAAPSTPPASNDYQTTTLGQPPA